MDSRCPAATTCSGSEPVGYERPVVLMSSVALAWLLASALLLPGLGRLLRAGHPPAPELPPVDAPPRPCLRVVTEPVR